jgi:single-strand DNA-binding protein
VRSTAEFISKYFKKGSMIVVQGRLQSRKWEDRDGNKRTSWEIQVNNAYFGESKKETNSSNSAPEFTDEDAPQIADLGDFDPENELPFEL